MTNFLGRLALSLIGGRRVAYRLGRSMYLLARGDIANDMERNGEMLIQHCVLAAWKQRALKENLVVFDVGANVGDWSTALLRQLHYFSIDDRVDVFSFEPVPSTFATLRRNLSGRPGLHVEQLALSSFSGTAKIYVAGTNSGTNSMHEDRPESQSFTIQQVAADDFCRDRGLEHIHLLKSDTEGHDMEVIRGALPLLKQERISVLQFEYNHRWVYSRNFLRDAFLAVEPLPYKVAKLQATHVLVFEKWHPELERFFEGNYAIIHEDAMTWFPLKYGSFDRFNSLSATQGK